MWDVWAVLRDVLVLNARPRNLDVFVVKCARFSVDMLLKRSWQSWGFAFCSSGD